MDMKGGDLLGTVWRRGQEMQGQVEEVCQQEGREEGKD